MAEVHDLAELASDYWKLLQAFERSALLAPEASRARLAAQARYSAERLSKLLERNGLRIVSFDGQRFEVNLPAIAINGDELAGSDALVERTIEPAVVGNSGVLIVGKVFLVPITKRES